MNYAKAKAGAIFVPYMKRVYLLLGSNEGDRAQWLDEATLELSLHCGDIVLKSAIYSTAAWGLEEQPDFLNMAVAINTHLSAEEFLKQIQAIEKKLGRQRSIKWGQRTLDIDILFYGNEIINQPNLTVPHPRMQDRRFVLVPLNDIAPNVMHPVFNKTVNTLLSDCIDPLEVNKV